MFKRVALLALALILLAGAAPALAAGEALPVSLDGKDLQAPALMVKDKPLLPVRALGESLGYAVEWQDDGTVTLNKDGRSIRLKVGDPLIMAGDHELRLQGRPELIGERTYAPPDFAFDALRLQAKWSKGQAVVELQSLRENAVAIETVVDKSETKTLQINFQVPRLQGLANKAAAEKINAIFAEEARKLKDDALKNDQDLAKEQLTRHIKTAAWFDYRIKYNQNGLLCVWLMKYIYTGGAHGMTFPSTYTFNLETGEALQLKNLFREETDYVSLLTGAIKKQIAARYQPPLFANFKAIKPGQDFYLSSDSLVIYFQLYEYTPYALGIPEFAIDFASLGDKLKIKLAAK